MKLPAWLTRANPENPATSLSDPASWLWGAVGARTSAASVTVSPESALETAAVWAAVRRISSTLATLPLPVYRQTESGKEKARTHPAYTLLHDRPNPEQSSFVWRELMLAHVLLYGNAYSEIERNGRGDAIALWPLHPSNVAVKRIGQTKVYVVRVGTQEVVLSAENVLHVQGFSLDGQSGLIPTSLARDAIGLSKATELYGSSFFANGAQPSGILSTTERLNKESSERLKVSWAAAQGGLSNSQRIAVLDAGLQFIPFGIPPEHAQFLETRRFSVTEIARVFLIPPHMIGDLDRATFSNIEAQSIEYVTACIEPWAKRIEQELNYKLFAGTEYHAEFVLDGLLRGDSAARAEFYSKMASLGVFSVNEIRDRENLNRIDGGDVRYVQANMMLLGEQGAANVTAV